MADVGTIVANEDITLCSKVGTLAEDLAGGLFRVQLAFGHHRLRAFQHLVATAVPGYEDAYFPVHVDALTDEQMFDAVWSEKLRERKDISAVEEAELLARKLKRSAASVKWPKPGVSTGLPRRQPAAPLGAAC